MSTAMQRSIRKRECPINLPQIHDSAFRRAEYPDGLRRQ
jgi:hypothetical protein